MEQKWSTPGPEGEPGRNSTWAPGGAGAPTATPPLSEANRTAVYPQGLQDQCWETYVGQVAPFPPHGTLCIHIIT